MSKRLTPPLLALLAILTIWEILVRSGTTPSYLLPAPSMIAKSLMLERAELFPAFLSTLESTALGFCASAVGGLCLAVLLSMIPLLHQAFYPYAVFFQTVPIVAIAPLLVVWFGYGMPSVIASAFIVSIFPMIANSLLGLRSTDPALLDLFKIYRAGRLQTLWKLRLPFALPFILEGLRIVAGLAVIGTVVGEFVGGVGLGSVIDIARTQQRVDKIFAAVGLSALLGFFAVAAIDGLGRLLLSHWHPSQRQT